jgi:hypothetical protein
MGLPSQKISQDPQEVFAVEIGKRDGRVLSLVNEPCQPELVQATGLIRRKKLHDTH